MKYTKGQWKVSGQSENSKYITVKSDNGRTVARVLWNTDKDAEKNGHTDYYDALLIAYAPEILDMLKECRDVLDRYHDNFSYEIDAVINKAERGELIA